MFSRNNSKVLAQVIRLLPIIFFIVGLFLLGTSGKAIEFAQNPNSSLEARLEEMQKKYEDALYKNYSQYADVFEKAYKTYPVRVIQFSRKQQGFSLLKQGRQF